MRFEDLKKGEDGEWLWSWNGQGLATVLEGTSEHGPWTVSLVQLSGRSKLKTKAGVGLRATRKAVEAAYPSGAYDPFGKRDELTLVKLSPSEWLFINYENDRVERMELRDPADCAGDCS